MDTQDEALEWLQHEAEPRTIAEIQVGIGSPSSAQVFHDIYQLMIEGKVSQHRLPDRQAGYKAVFHE